MITKFRVEVTVNFDTPRVGFYSTYSYLFDTPADRDSFVDYCQSRGWVVKCGVDHSYTAASAIASVRNHEAAMKRDLGLAE